LFDAVYLVRSDRMFANVAYYMIAAGVVTGVVAAVFGLIDYVAIPPGTRAKRVGALHGLGSFAVVVLFAVSWMLRSDSSTSPEPVALLFSLGGVALLGFSGWLGGELLNRMGVGIDDGAHLNAQSSLAGPVVPSAPIGGPESAQPNRS
jgi:uncharacterized membrane protein